jgi:hypothetical protein
VDHQPRTKKLVESKVGSGRGKSPKSSFKIYVGIRTYDLEPKIPRGLQRRIKFEKAYDEEDHTRCRALRVHCGRRVSPNSGPTAQDTMQTNDMSKDGMKKDGASK